MFRITIHNRKLTANFDPLDESIAEAIETVYSDDSHITIAWHGFPIQLSLKYDVSAIWNDIQLLLLNLKNPEIEQFEVFWPSQNFFANWHIQKQNDLLTIRAFWTSIYGGPSNLAQIRAIPNEISIDEASFRQAWANLSEMVKTDLRLSGYKDWIGS